MAGAVGSGCEGICDGCFSAYVRAGSRFCSECGECGAGEKKEGEAMTEGQRQREYEDLLERVVELQKKGDLPVRPTREQIVDWAYGNTKIENGDITRAMVIDAVDRKALNDEGGKAMTMGQMLNSKAEQADADELKRHLEVVRGEGYLRGSDDVPTQRLMSRAIDTLERIEEKAPGSLARGSASPVVVALREIARACQPVIARAERASRGVQALPLTFKLRGLKGGAR